MLACEKNVPSPAGNAELMKVSAQFLVWVWCTMEIKPSREVNLGGFQREKAAELIKKPLMVNIVAQVWGGQKNPD